MRPIVLSLHLTLLLNNFVAFRVPALPPLRSYHQYELLVVSFSKRGYSCAAGCGLSDNSSTKSPQPQ